MKVISFSSSIAVLTVGLLTLSAQLTADDLFSAIYDGSLARVKKLLSENRNPNQIDPNNTNDERITPLMIASENGRLDIMKELLNAGARPNEISEHGWTALALAQTIGQKETPKTDNRCLPTGWTPLIVAQHKKDLEKRNKAIRMLQDAGAHANAVAGNDLTIAAIADNKKAIQALLQSGSTLDIRDHNGWTPLMRTIDAIEIDEDYDGVYYLVEAGADLNAVGNTGWTALLIAAQDEKEDIVQLLLESGARLPTKEEIQGVNLSPDGRSIIEKNQQFYDIYRAKRSAVRQGLKNKAAKEVGLREPGIRKLIDEMIFGKTLIAPKSRSSRKRALSLEIDDEQSDSEDKKGPVKKQKNPKYDSESDEESDKEDMNIL